MPTTTAQDPPSDKLDSGPAGIPAGSAGTGPVGPVGSAGSEITYNFQIAAGTSVGALSIVTQGVGGKDFVDAGATTCRNNHVPLPAPNHFQSNNVDIISIAASLHLRVVFSTVQ